MVYLPPETSGWRPLARSWLQGLAALITAAPESPGGERAADSQQSQDQAAAAGEAQAAGGKAAGGPAAPAAAAAEEAEGELQPVQEFVWSLLEAFVDPLLAWLRARGGGGSGGGCGGVADAARVHGVTVLLGRLLETEG